MWHSRMTSDEIEAVSKSAAYPLLTSLHGKLKLVVIDYKMVKSEDPMYLMGTENGLAVLRLLLNDEGEWFAHVADAPLGPVNDWHNVSQVAKSKNTRYLVKAITADNRMSGQKVLKSLERATNNNLYNALSLMCSEIKRKRTDISVAPLQEEHMYSAISVLVGDTTMHEMPMASLSALQDWYKQYTARINHRAKLDDDLATIFSGEKWLLCAKRNLSGSIYSYFVCALDTKTLGLAAKNGHISGVNISALMTTPIQLYRDLNSLPDSFKNAVLGSLTMWKQYRSRNFPDVGCINFEGYFPYTSLMDEDSGTVAWGHGGSYYLMLDK